MVKTWLRERNLDSMVGSFICLSWPYCAGQAFSHLFTHGLRVLSPLRYDGSCECSHHFAGCQCSAPPTGEARICVSNFSYLLGPKNRPFGVTGRAKAIQMTTSWTPELAQVHVTGPPSPLPPKQRFKNASFCKVKTLL